MIDEAKAPGGVMSISMANAENNNMILLVIIRFFEPWRKFRANLETNRSDYYTPFQSNELHWTTMSPQEWEAS